VTADGIQRRASGLDILASHRYGGAPIEGALTGTAHILETLHARADSEAAAPFLTAVSVAGSDTVITYGALRDNSARLAEWLRLQLGVERGEVIALAPTNDAASVIAIFALLAAGARIFFINPDEKAERLRELLDGRQVRHIIYTDATKAERLPGVRILPDARELEQHRIGAIDPLPNLSDTAFYFGTSGSTAASKIVAQTFENVSANAEAVRRLHGFGPGTVFLGCLPIHHVNGLHFTIMATVWSGAHAILLERFNPHHYADCMRRYRPHLASVVPSLLEILLCGEDESFVPPGFRYFVSAAAPLSATTCRQVLKRFNVRVNQAYGLTETTNFSTTIPPGLGEASYRRLMTDAEIPSIGSAVFGNEVAVLRPDGAPARHGERGEVCMRGYNVMRGYDRNEDATRDALRGGWFHSGDLGYSLLDEETGEEFFFLTGRAKNIAKVMGVAVSLEEMEHTLLKHPAVLDAACFTVPDQLLGEAITAAVVSDDRFDVDELRGHLLTRFSEAVLPMRFVRAKQIPRTATGKIIRAGLAATLA
jgi:acyl-CoA synthetase (AMP-forming)/AMP-acid ligase II